MPRLRLEPCMKCGAAARLEYTHNTSDGRKYRVCCENGHTHRWYGLGAEAARGWNELQHRLQEYGNCVRWVDKTDRLPTEADADAQGCVLIWDRYNGVKVTGWRNAQELGRENVTHWAAMPQGPGWEAKKFPADIRWEGLE